MPELYIVYTGEAEHTEEMLSLNKEFFEGKSWAIDLNAKVIYNSEGKSLLNQYIYFCKVWREQHRACSNKQQAIENTLRICIKAGVLEEYLEHRQKEVVNMMKLLYDQDLIDHLHDVNIKREEREKVTAEFEQRLADKDVELSDKNRELANKDAELANQAAEIARLKAELAKKEK